MSDQLLHSERTAARLLGVSRDTIAELRRAGVLRTVAWPGQIGFRIPLEEIQRLAREGVPVAGQQAKPPRRRAPSTDPAAAIRAIRVEDL